MARAPDYNPIDDPFYNRPPPPEGATPVEGEVSWSQVVGAPSTFPPSAHVHDDRYPSKTDTTAALAGKAATVHDHDDRYYREGEVNTLLAGKASTAHDHDSRYYTESEVDTALVGKAATGHLHDERYYTESETDAALAGKAATEHQHAIADVTNLQSTLDGKAASSHQHVIADVQDLQTTLGGKASSLHDHDSRYAQLGDLNVTPLVLKYDAATSSWPARPVSSRVVFWLALSEAVPRPAGATDYDVVFRGAQ